MKLKLIFVALLILATTVSGCGKATPANGKEDLKAQLKAKEDLIITLTAEKESLSAQVTSLQQQLQAVQSGQSSLFSTALTVVELLKAKDMVALANHIHPVKGVRFTPYPYVDLQADLVFTSQQITNLLQSSQVYTWGSFDGTGDPIDLTFSDYYDRFVYDADYANAHLIGNNIEIGTGNAIHNIPQAYPNATFIEFHFTGFDPQYSGMDWRSLRLVFENQNNTWYLVGIVHGEWTI